MVTNHESGRASRASGSLYNSALFFFSECTVHCSELEKEEEVWASL